ncbi:hypothetical protein PYI39_12250, partial [Staphylococcus epidermidis]|nr:hypothetical protein [Staphylococcus epidermidis]MDH8891160.1 hypothetical protein [Staphylococcus epidermidis]
TAQRAENNQKNNKKDNFYIISIEIVFFYLSWDFMSHTHFFLNSLEKIDCFCSFFFDAFGVMISSFESILSVSIFGSVAK